MSRKVAVIGSGVGGLSCALRLAHRGFEVSVYEKLSECGGRAHIIEDKGFKFDTGPSFVLMPDFFQEVFSSCGCDLRQHLDLKVLDTSYKIFYPSGKTFTVFRDKEKTKDQLESFEPGSGRRYDDFIARTGKFYKVVRPLLYECFRPKDIFSLRALKLLSQLNVSQTYWNLAGKYFKSQELCSAFTFEAMFIGVSPFKTPSFYSVITYTDHIQKIFHPIGGMYQIPKVLEGLSKDGGVKFNYNSEVKSIKTAGEHLLVDLGSDRAAFDIVIANSDYSYTQSALLNRPLPDYKYSCSVYLIYVGTRTKVSGLEHHNLFFSSDLKKNLSQIFDQAVIPQDPSFYIHVPTITDSSLAPEGKDILYILVPVPNLIRNGYDFAEYEGHLRRVIFDKVKSTAGIDIEKISEVEHRFYPRDFVDRYNIKYGATFGLAHTLLQSAFFRPANIDSKIKNLYYVGASTQPGGGLPPVIAGSRIVADLIDKGKPA